MHGSYGFLVRRQVALKSFHYSYVTVDDAGHVSAGSTLICSEWLATLRGIDSFS